MRRVQVQGQTGVHKLPVRPAEDTNDTAAAATATIAGTTAATATSVGTVWMRVEHGLLPHRAVVETTQRGFSAASAAGRTCELHAGSKGLAGVRASAHTKDRDLT